MQARLIVRAAIALGATIMIALLVLSVYRPVQAAAVLTRGSLTLQANSVYTFFMTDNGATPIGVLRRDR